jgi:hypothetical protein
MKEQEKKEKLHPLLPSGGEGGERFSPQFYLAPYFVKQQLPEHSRIILNEKRIITNTLGKNKK